MAAHKDGVIIIPSQYRARDGMRDNLNFVYLTGFKEPDAVLVLDPAGSPRETLFTRSSGVRGREARSAAGWAEQKRSQGRAPAPVSRPSKTRPARTRDSSRSRTPSFHPPFSAWSRAAAPNASISPSPTSIS